MFKIIRHRILPAINVQACSYSATGGESKSPPMPPELTKATDVSTQEKLAELMKDDDLKWRTPWHQNEGQYYSLLRTFYTEHNNTAITKFLQSPIDLSPSSIKKWWAKKKRNQAIIAQNFIPERNQVLGNELAAAHFIVFRGGAVKFFGQDHWIKANQFKQYELPNRFEEHWYLQAIDCTDMELFYEGLSNLRDLRRLEWLSVSGCEEMDDWCMDRISGMFGRSLLYLDIRDCPNISHRGIGALAKMTRLKILYVNDLVYTKEYEMTCLMLQEVLPDLDIRIE
ncbi:hypothetical protein Trydic_g5837 [Trypoxylus dichotomus]